MTKSRRRRSVFRAHPWLSIMGAIVGLIVFLAVLPVVPFMPMCQQKLGDWEDMGIVFGWMIPEYRELLTEEFDNMGVYHWEIGPIVLIRALPWLDGRDSFDQTDGIANAENKAAWYLAEGDYDGEVIVEGVVLRARTRQGAPRPGERSLRHGELRVQTGGDSRRRPIIDLGA
jgi:hypothetical protein